MLPPELIYAIKSLLPSRDLRNLNLTCFYVYRTEITETEKQLRKCYLFFYPSEDIFVRRFHSPMPCYHLCCWKYAAPYLKRTEINISHLELQTIIRNGNLALIQFVCDTFFPNAKCFEPEYLLKSAIASGCIEIFDYICEKCRITVHDIRAYVDQSNINLTYDFYLGAWSRHWYDDDNTLLLQHIIKKSYCNDQKLTIRDVRAKNNIFLNCAARQGDVAFLKFLCETSFPIDPNFPNDSGTLTVSDVRNSEALQWTNSFPCFKYLCERYEVTEDDVRCRIFPDTSAIWKQYLLKNFRFSAMERRLLY